MRLCPFIFVEKCNKHLQVALQKANKTDFRSIDFRNTFFFLSFSLKSKSIDRFANLIGSHEQTCEINYKTNLLCEGDDASC